MINTTVKELTVTSPAFREEGNIPAEYTCEGEGVNPPIQIDNIPEEAQSLAVIAEDPDAPKGVFDHWVAWNIPVSSRIEKDCRAGISGLNSAGKTGYTGPCPPSGSHRYYFNFFALDALLDLPAGSNKQALTAAMEAHLLAKGSIMGRYQKLHTGK